MRFLRKMTAFLLALVLICQFVPAVHAETVASGICGENLTWTLDSNGKMTIRGSGRMWDFLDDSPSYDYHPCPWEEYKLQIKSVVFEDGITYVGASAFYLCENLSAVQFTDSIQKIGNFSFFCCERLQNFVLPKNLQSLGQEAFAGCPCITSVTIPSTLGFLDGGVFSWDTGLTYVYFEGYSGGVFVSGDSPFRGCSSLEAIGVADSHFALFSSDGVLYQQDSLLQYPLGKKDIKYRVISGTTNIVQFAFEDAVYLEQVVIPDTVESIGHSAFCGCRKLNSIRFEGDAPAFLRDTFERVTATVYYPAGNSTWTADIMQDYGGTLTWVAYTPKDGWEKEDGKWYYYEDNQLVTGWKKISAKWYYFNSTGILQTGWKQISGKWYYLGTDGAMQTGWKQISGKWYYLGTDGAMCTGMQKIGGKLYYFGSNGVWQKYTGWKQISAKWYYFDSNGVALTGWQKVNSKWYYMDANGVMQTGWKQI
ncbi:MAG: leucine-rich repeat protein, partial [Firmicutes bacterium]|nr:leucine-rich repeat protein [Bacillota bacterium]